MHTSCAQLQKTRAIMATKEEGSVVDRKVQEKRESQSSIPEFISNNKGDTANVFCSWIVFFVYGIILTYVPYGYGTGDDSKRTSRKCDAKYNG